MLNVLHEPFSAILQVEYSTLIKHADTPNE